MARPRRESRRHNGITDRRRPQPTFAKKSAISGSERQLLDHLVSASEERWGNRQPKCISSLEIDHKLEFGRLLDWQVGGLGTAQQLDELPRHHIPVERE